MYMHLLLIYQTTQRAVVPGPFWAPGILCGRRQVVHNPIDQVLLFAITIPNGGV